MKAIKAEQTIEKCAFQAGISPQAKNWLDRALDPFKDIVQSIEGYPDMNCAPSCVQEVKKQLTIAAPSAASWDCNIFFSQTPLTKNLYLTTRNYGTLIQSTQSATPYKEGGVIVRKATAGTTLDMTTTTDSVELGQNYYSNSETRVIGWAFEVTDVTSELYRQGAVTVWRSPLVTDPNDATTYTCVYDTGATACVPTAYDIVSMGSVPTTSADALLLPNSQQWDAKEGCYVVAIQDGQDNPARTYGYKLLIRFESPTVAYTEQINSTGVAKQIFIADGQKVDLPFIPGGAYFTGLNANSVLQLTVRYYVERFPSKDNLDLVVLARPSTPYDPRALEVYSKLASRLPTGTRKRDNGLGDWISSIARGISSVVGAFSPIAGGILGASAGMQQYFNNFDTTSARSNMSNSRWTHENPGFEQYSNTPTANRISPPVNPPMPKQVVQQVRIKDNSKEKELMNQVAQLKIENKRLKMIEKAELKQIPVKQGPFMPNGKFKSNNNKKKLANQKFVYVNRT
jgi:hypothetical protein